jgi:hypothetical protein
MTALVSAALLLTGCTGAGPEPTETLADGPAPVPASSSAAPAPSRPAPSSARPTATSAADDSGAGSSGGGGSSSSGSGSSGGSGSGGGSTPTPVRACTGAELAVSVAADPQRSEMGQRAFRITFRNIGKVPCTLKGYPQVAATGRGTHTPIGEAAEPDVRYTPKTERLAPGGTRAAILLADNIDEHGGPYSDGDTDHCGTTAGDGYVISPPESAKVFEVDRDHLWACTTEVHWMRVSPVLVP